MSQYKREIDGLVRTPMNRMAFSTDTVAYLNQQAELKDNFSPIEGFDDEGAFSEAPKASQFTDIFDTKGNLSLIASHLRQANPALVSKFTRDVFIKLAELVEKLSRYGKFSRFELSQFYLNKGELQVIFPESCVRLNRRAAEGPFGQTLESTESKPEANSTKIEASRFGKCLYQFLTGNMEVDFSFGFNEEEFDLAVFKTPEGEQFKAIITQLLGFSSPKISIHQALKQLCRIESLLLQKKIACYALLQTLEKTASHRPDNSLQEKAFLISTAKHGDDLAALYGSLSDQIEKHLQKSKVSCRVVLDKTSKLLLVLQQKSIQAKYDAPLINNAEAAITQATPDNVNDFLNLLQVHYAKLLQQANRYNLVLPAPQSVVPIASNHSLLKGMPMAGKKRALEESNLVSKQANHGRSPMFFSEKGRQEPAVAFHVNGEKPHSLTRDDQEIAQQLQGMSINLEPGTPR